MTEKEKKAEYDKVYRLKNKERIKEKTKEYYLKNSEIVKQRVREWTKTNLEKKRAYDKEYYTIPLNRAKALLRCYNRDDAENDRGVGDLTAEWIVEHIFSQPCTHCGKTGWDVVGCNRLDNSKPHTTDNVEPCCGKCNVKLGGGRPKRKIDQIDMVTGEVIKTWSSGKEARLAGYTQAAGAALHTNNIKQHKGYLWRYHK